MVAATLNCLAVRYALFRGQVCLWYHYL